MQSLEVGILNPILLMVKENDTLMLSIREQYINIYYRGGSLLRVSAHSEPTEASPDANATYVVDFDQNYNNDNRPLPIDFPYTISNEDESLRLVDAVPILKHAIDRFLTASNKPEREFQQLVARENNYSMISSDTDYFIIDIEISGALAKARYDMLAVRWLDNTKGKSGKVVPVLLEMKYGIGALGGTSGLNKHLTDAYALKKSPDSWNAVVSTLQSQISQLDQLGLLKFNRGKNNPNMRIDRFATPQLVFLLANYNPASKQLHEFLASIDESAAADSGFDLRFFASCFAGFGMHRESMLNLSEFKVEVSRLHNLAIAKAIPIEKPITSIVA